MPEAFGNLALALALRSLPKAEVHVHLEGCFEPATLEQWAEEAGVHMPRRAGTSIPVHGLADFLHFLDWACGLANSRAACRMASNFCKRLQSDGTGYADVIVNPTHWSAWRGRTRSMIEAARQARWPRRQSECATADARAQPVAVRPARRRRNPHRVHRTSKSRSALCFLRARELPTPLAPIPHCTRARRPASTRASAKGETTVRAEG